MPSLNVDPSATLFGDGFGGFNGFEWAVPAFILAVPGLLLILAVLAQGVGALFWLPFVRRWLGAFGLWRRKRHRQPAG